MEDNKLKRNCKTGRPEEYKEGYYYYFYKDETYLESKEFIWDYKQEKILHSINDKPATIYDDGSKDYYKDGKRHRDGDRPAIINSDGSKYYFKNGKLHRKNGPAIIWSNGVKKYWINGKELTIREFLEYYYSKNGNITIFLLDEDKETRKEAEKLIKEKKDYK